MLPVNEMEGAGFSVTSKSIFLFSPCCYKKEFKKYDCTSFNTGRPKVAFDSGRSITLVDEFITVKLDYAIIQKS